MAQADESRCDPSRAPRKHCWMRKGSTTSSGCRVPPSVAASCRSTGRRRIINHIRQESAARAGRNLRIHLGRPPRYTRTESSRVRHPYSHIAPRRKRLAMRGVRGSGVRGWCPCTSIRGKMPAARSTIGKLISRRKRDDGQCQSGRGAVRSKVPRGSSRHQRERRQVELDRTGRMVLSDHESSWKSSSARVEDLHDDGLRRGISRQEHVARLKVGRMEARSPGRPAGHEVRRPVDAELVRHDVRQRSIAGPGGPKIRRGRGPQSGELPPR